MRVQKVLSEGRDDFKELHKVQTFKQVSKLNTSSSNKTNTAIHCV
jgi:hypothetical protein